MKTAEHIINEKGRDMICVTEDATIHDALTIMVEHKIGAILVKRDGVIEGIWTERDLMRNVLEEGFDPKTARIKDYMVTGLKHGVADDSVYSLMDKFLGLHLRHLPILKGEHYIGMLSTGDALKATLNEKTRELKELNTMVSWEYYENWQWKKQ